MYKSGSSNGVPTLLSTSTYGVLYDTSIAPRIQADTPPSSWTYSVITGGALLETQEVV